MNGKQKSEYDTRKILEQMREEYWRALSEVEADEAKDLLQMVTVILGDEVFGIPAVQAKEILKMPPLVRVPRTPASILGIFNLRGKITSVVDIRPVLGLRQPDMSAKNRVVLIETGTLSTGILVEDIREITHAPRESIIPVAKAIARKEYLAGQTEIDNKLVVMLDMEKILNAPEFIIKG